MLTRKANPLIRLNPWNISPHQTCCNVCIQELLQQRGGGIGLLQPASGAAAPAALDATGSHTSGATFNMPTERCSLGNLCPSCNVLPQLQCCPYGHQLCQASLVAPQQASSRYTLVEIWKAQYASLYTTS